MAINVLIPAVVISIHALREEGDRETRRNTRFCMDFNPRPPRGGRQERQEQNGIQCTFQSTPSARRATTAE